MTYTIQVHGSNANGTPQEVSSQVEAAIRTLVQTLQGQGHTIGGGQTSLPDGRTIDALNIAKGGPSTTAEPANSPARTTSEQTLAGQNASQAPQDGSQAASAPSGAPSGSQGAQTGSQATGTATVGSPTGSKASTASPTGKDATSTPSQPSGGQGTARTGSRAR